MSTYDLSYQVTLADAKMIHVQHTVLIQLIDAYSVIMHHAIWQVGVQFCSSAQHRRINLTNVNVIKIGPV